MITIEVKKTEVIVSKSNPAKPFMRDGQEITWDFKRQLMYADFHDGGYPKEIKPRLPDDVQFYQPGKYTIASNSFMVNPKGELVFGKALYLQALTPVEKVK